MKVRDVLPTPYGNGVRLLHRERDDTYKIDLTYGFLYAPRSTVERWEQQEQQQQQDNEVENSDGNHDDVNETKEDTNNNNDDILEQPLDEEEKKSVACGEHDDTAKKEDGHPFPKQSEKDDDETITPAVTKKKDNDIMELNIAYESLEKMRKLNLEVALQERGIALEDLEIDIDQVCTYCLLENTPPVDTAKQAATVASQANNANANTNTSQRPRFPHLQKLMNQPLVKDLPMASSVSAAVSSQTITGPRFPRIQRAMNQQRQRMTYRPGKPCIICASPCCSASKHSSANYRKQNIIMCCACEQLFSLDFVVQCLTSQTSAERRKHLDRMMDVYDRTRLLLQYSYPYISTIAKTLEQTKERQNKMTMGSSSVGMVSGTLGVAAAATILTPVGVPLLMASLALGVGATAVQTGTELKNSFFSEPHKSADRILALHGMAQSILRIVGTLRDAMLRYHIRTDVFLDDGNNQDGLNAVSVKKNLDKNQNKILAGVQVSRSAMAGLEAGAMGSLAGAEIGTLAGMELGTLAATGAETGVMNAQLLSRTSTNLMKTVRVARVAGGALSAATILLEARCMTTTLQDIRNGNPCEKAIKLRNVENDLLLDTFPSTEQLDKELENYLKALQDRERALTQEEVVQILIEQMEQEQTMEEDATPVIADSTGDLDLHEERDENDEPMRASLIERIEKYKQQGQDLPATTTSETRPPSSSLTSKSSADTSANADPPAAESASAASTSTPAATTTANPPLPNERSSGLSLFQRIAIHKHRFQNEEVIPPPPTLG